MPPYLIRLFDRPHLNVREALELSPWQKWLLYGRFPWKMLLHLTLVVLITVQAWLVNSHYAAYSRAVGRNFANLFFPDKQQVADVRSYTYRIYTVKETIKDAHKLLNTYFKLPSISVDAVAVATPDGAADDCEGMDSCGLPLPVIQMTTAEGETNYVMEDASSPWPLQIGGEVDSWVEEEDVTKVRSFFHDLRTLKFSFVVKSRGWGGGIDRTREVCLLWRIHFLYDLTVGGQFVVSFAYDAVDRCKPVSFGDRYMVFCAIIGVMAIIYQILLLKALFRHVVIVNELRMRSGPSQAGSMVRRSTPSTVGQSSIAPSHLSPPLGGGEKQPLLGEPLPEAYHSLPRPSGSGGGGGGGGGGGSSVNSVLRMSVADGRSVTAQEAVAAWENLTCADKLALLNVWNIIATVGNVCAIIYTVGSVWLQIDIITVTPLRMLIGLACLTLWLALLQYLEFINPRYYVMILTLKTAIPRIGRFLVGIFPCFVGYSLLGMILFGDRNDLFGSLLDTITTLFCIVNGDSIMMVLDSVSSVPVIGELYICVYIMLFMYVCLMTCIAIVEGSFFEAADHAHDVWVRSRDATEDGLLEACGPLDEERGRTRRPGAVGGAEGGRGRGGREEGPPSLVSGVSLASSSSGAGGRGRSGVQPGVGTPGRRGSGGGGGSSSGAGGGAGGGGGGRWMSHNVRMLIRSASGEGSRPSSAPEPDAPITSHTGMGKRVPSSTLAAEEQKGQGCDDDVDSALSDLQTTLLSSLDGMSGEQGREQVVRAVEAARARLVQRRARGNSATSPVVGTTYR